jgi:hypothetical protein
LSAWSYRSTVDSPFPAEYLDLTMLKPDDRRMMLRTFEVLNGPVWARHNGIAVLLSHCLMVLQMPDAFPDSRWD